MRRCSNCGYEPKLKYDASKKVTGVGARVRIARLAKGLTQGELAKAIGYQRTTIANIEKNRQKLSLSQAYMVSEALMVTVNYLMGIEGEHGDAYAIPSKCDVAAR